MKEKESSNDSRRHIIQQKKKEVEIASRKLEEQERELVGKLFSREKHRMIYTAIMDRKNWIEINESKKNYMPIQRNIVKRKLRPIK